MENKLETILGDYKAYLSRCATVNPKSQESYLSYVRSLDKANEGQTCEWLRKAINEKEEGPISSLVRSFEDYFSAHPEKKALSQWKTGLMRLGDFVCGITNSSINLKSINIKNFDLFACQLVAQSAVFCSKKIFDEVKDGKEGSAINQELKGNEFGAWCHYTVKRAKGGKKGEYDGEVRLDDNTYANTAIKTAVLKGLKDYGIYTGSKQLFQGFEACHIWPETCYDARYHTSVGNIVLLPREVAGLTDHCQAVEDLLKYEAWERFRFKPAEEKIPAKPKFYNEIVWRNKK